MYVLLVHMYWICTYVRKYSKFRMCDDLFVHMYVCLKHKTCMHILYNVYTYVYTYIICTVSIYVCTVHTVLHTVLCILIYCVCLPILESKPFNLTQPRPRIVPTPEKVSKFMCTHACIHVIAKVRTSREAVVGIQTPLPN